jgi:D-alanyl-D-alanine carboxypeptidase
MMIDAGSGATLYADSEHEKVERASLAELMTFHLALRALHRGLITPDRMRARPGPNSAQIRPRGTEGSNPQRQAGSSLCIPKSLSG